MVYVGPLICSVPTDGEIKRAHGYLYCRMTASTWVELQTMAKRVGLPPGGWFQRGDYCFISARHRGYALAFGAVEGEAPTRQKHEIAQKRAETAET